MMEKIRLGDAFSFIRNGANIKQGLDDSGYPITRIETISDRTVNREKMGYAGITDVGKYDDYILQDGDILMSHINSEKHLGKTAIYKKQKDEKIIHGMNLLCLRPDNSQILPEYAFYFLSSNDFLRQIPNITKKSVNQASFTVTALKKLSFAKRGIDEQKKIVCELDKVTDLIDKRKQQLSKLDELVKSRFVELFENSNYPIIRLGDVCTKITDGTHKTPTYLESGITFISAKNIVNGELDFSDIKHISEQEYDEIQRRCQTEMGDILLSKSGSLGSPVIVKTTQKLGLFESLAVIKYDRDRLLPEFLCEQLKTDRIQRQFKVGTKGVAIKHLHLGVIADTDIIIPPIEEQQVFAAFVEQTDKSKLEVQKSLEKLEVLKKALMQKYFG